MIKRNLSPIEALPDKQYELLNEITDLFMILKKKEHRLIATCEEISFQDEITKKFYIKSPSIVIIDDYNEPILIFDIAKDRSGIPYTTSNRLVYEKIGVKEYNVVFENGDIIQYFLDDEKRYEMRICRKGDMFKSNIYAGLNILVDDVIAGRSKRDEECKKKDKKLKMQFIL